ncbi:MAG: TIGR02757 family protein [Synergistaceae bacterium]|jgi:uncharacterized protein (TIGR02757 family)|nr:TIGR02757 family protein [Synergistaceae bacterium]
MKNNEDLTRLSSDKARLKAFLEGLYFVYNRRELVFPDPLVFLYGYDDPLDREVVGLIASCLAYGRVAQILKSVEKILAPMGACPHCFLLEEKPRSQSFFQTLFKDFKHRFTTGKDMAALLERVSQILREYGSLEALLKEGLQREGTLLAALNFFSHELTLRKEGLRKGFPLLTAPEDGSACKRLSLYLKWMTRRDEVDPGGWTAISPKNLLMPTDTHIHRIALQLGLTKRKQADLTTVLEITQNFAKLTPEDPTRYDFVLSRFGIRQGLNISDVI